MVSQLLKSLLRISLLVVSLVIISVEAPIVHQKWLMTSTADSVFIVTSPIDQNSGGTGFQINTPSGPKIITNAHVCRSLEDGLAMMHTDAGETFLRSVVKVSKKADLCMIEGNADYPSLNLGSEVDMYDHIQVIGHPLLQPLTPAPGYIIGRGDVNVGIGLLGDEECKAANGEQYDMLFFRLCVVKYDSLLTNAVTYPGNSGSPVVNFWGNVVAVLFAGNNRTNYGVLVPFEYLEEFIGQSTTSQEPR